MKTGLPAISTALLVLLLAYTPLACHTRTLQGQAEATAVADGVTAVGGFALGAAEANPLGVFSLIIKAPLLAHVKTLPLDEQAQWHATYGAVWGGASANNLCVIGAILTGGALAPACPMVGVAWGLNQWSASATERELWAICRQERAYWGNPRMPCNFFGKAAGQHAPPPGAKPADKPVEKAAS